MSDYDFIFHFNKIIVIESLKDREEKTGSKLYESVVNKFPFKAEYFETDFKKVNGRKDLLNVLNEIAITVSKEDRYPFLHFEIHGNENGIVLNSNYLVPWSELAFHLRKINVATKNNLFISLATCYGANIFKGIDLTKKAPFFGFIATWEKINNSEVTETFEEFFNQLLYSLRTDNNTADFNLSLASLPKKMNFIYAEMVFEKVWNFYQEGLKDKSKYMDRLRNLVVRANSNQDPRNMRTLPELYYSLNRQLNNFENQKKLMRKAFLDF